MSDHRSDLIKLIDQLLAIHAADIPDYPKAECIECGVGWPCDTARLVSEWEVAA